MPGTLIFTTTLAERDQFEISHGAIKATHHSSAIDLLNQGQNVVVGMNLICGWRAPNGTNIIFSDSFPKDGPERIQAMARVYPAEVIAAKKAYQEANTTVVADHGAFEIPGPENYYYYGGLHLKREGGVDYWSIENYDGHDWKICDQRIADALRAVFAEQPSN